MDNANSAAYAATILRPRQEVYEFWRDWQNLSRYSRHLKAVTDLGDGRTRWTAEGPQNDITWEAITKEDIPGERIIWESVEGSDIHHRGVVMFSDAPGDRGTEVMVRMAYDMPGGIVGEAIAKWTGNSPESEVAESVRRFKAILECGECPVIEGQPSNQMRRENIPGDESPKAGLR